MRTQISSAIAVLSLAGSVASVAACSATREPSGNSAAPEHDALGTEASCDSVNACADADVPAHDLPSEAREPDESATSAACDGATCAALPARPPLSAPVAVAPEPDTVIEAREQDAMAPAREAFSDWAAEPYAQRKGDAERGRRLLLDNGTADVPYVSCGLPEEVVKLAGLDSSWPSALKIADRRDKDLPYDSSYVTRPSGVKLVSTNCLFCHAATLGGQLIIGLPDANRDFTQPDLLVGLSGVTLRVAASLILDPPAEAELARLLRIVDATAQFPQPDTIGINPADSLFGMLAMHRDPETLAWLAKPDPMAGPVPKRIIFSDVPALWNTHRRPHLFNTGFAHGDLSRVMMTASLLCLEDRAEAERIDAYFPDIRAYIDSLRAPSYEQVSGLHIDRALAQRGQAHFENLCRRCHGDKDGEGGAAPRTFVALTEVGTDPIYAEVTAQENDLPEGQTINYFFDFFNRSWYGTHGATGKLVRPSFPGYVPPPLDGVWATAPYFHNGSVPTLDAVLDPAQRPRIFQRSFDPDAYDFQRLGYPYQERIAKLGDPAVYDTTQLGNSNQGHTFAAALTDVERAELLEYLKSF
jgi:mono/diheme cytochrome c family protein